MKDVFERSLQGIGERRAAKRPKDSTKRASYDTQPHGIITIKLKSQRFENIHLDQS